MGDWFDARLAGCLLVVNVWRLWGLVAMGSRGVCWGV